jgi:hypothetical protein
MGQAKRRGTFEQRRDAAIKLYNEKQAERDREADRNYVAPYGRANSLLPLYGLSAIESLATISGIPMSLLGRRR